MSKVKIQKIDETHSNLEFLLHKSHRTSNQHFLHRMSTARFINLFVLVLHLTSKWSKTLPNRLPVLHHAMSRPPVKLHAISRTEHARHLLQGINLTQGPRVVGMSVQKRPVAKCHYRRYKSQISRPRRWRCGYRKGSTKTIPSDANYKRSISDWN